MAQIDDLQAYVNIELPRRRPLITVAIAGYDGDPNGGSAPSILQLAPVGTWYLRETPLQMYEKLTAGTDTWAEAGSGGGGGGGGIVTETDMTIPVDYNDGSAVDPGADDLFASQQDIDDFLAANGTTNFKHLDRVWRATPSIVQHDLVFNLAAGVHRPSDDPENGSTSWTLSGKILLGGPEAGFFPIKIAGASSSNYTALVGSPGSPLTINSFDDGSTTKNPSLTFTGTPFAGVNLRGRYAILDTGQVAIIRDHDDSTLFIMAGISPVPTTCWVGKQSTILRNSLDDSSFVNSASFVVQGSAVSIALVSIEDVSIENFGGNGVIYQGSIEFMRGIRLTIDDLAPYETYAINPNGRPFQSSLYSTGLFNLFDSSYAAPKPVVGGNDGLWFISGRRSIIQKCYFAPYQYAIFRNGELELQGAYFDTGGSGTVPSLEILNSLLEPVTIGNNKDNEIHAAPGTGLFLEETKTPADLELSSGFQTPPEFVFSGCVGPCIKVNNKTVLDFRSSVRGIQDGGGNQDVGIELTGDHASVKLDANTDVTGTNGDVRMKDGLVSYTELETGDYTDTGLNIASKEP